MMTLARKMSGAFLAAGALVAGGANAALADDARDWAEYGTSISVGAGVQDFTNDRMQNTTDMGGMWDLRMAFGTTSPVGLEAAYIGSATPINSAFGPEESATLVGTGAEGLARVNIIPLGIVTPYAFGGLAWQRYDVTGADFTTADTGIQDEDTLLEVPVGAGLAFRPYGFVADARFTYRAALGEDLVIEDDTNPADSNSARAGMDTWGISARVGVEF